MEWISGCAAAVVLFAILIGGVVTCSIHTQEEATKRVTEVCSGDLKSDAVRAAACIMATDNARGAGR